MKRIICAFMASALLFLMGCSAAAPATPDPPAQTREPAPAASAPVAGEGIPFTDSLGREVMLPHGPGPITPGDEEARFALYALSPELETMNAASDKSAIVFMGRGVEKEALDKMQEEKGVPVIYLGGTYEELGRAYLTLGSLLGMEQEAEEIALYLESSLAAIHDLTGEMPAEDRTRVYYATGADGLTAGDSDIIALAGAVNIAQAGEKMTLDELALRNVGQIVFPAAGAYPKAESEWGSLEAVGMCLYYEAPNESFDWSNPSFAPDNVFAAKWLGTLLYPEQFTFDMVEETRMYYDLFRHRQLTSEEAESLLKNSSLKTIG